MGYLYFFTRVLCAMALCINESPAWEPGGCSKASYPYYTQPNPRNAVFIHVASCKSGFVGCTYRRSLSAFFPVILGLWILHHVSTASFLHPDPPLSPLGSDLHKSFLKSILVPSAIVPSYYMGLTTTSKPTFLITMTSIRLFVFYMMTWLCM